MYGQFNFQNFEINAYIHLQGRLVIAFDYAVEIWSINEPKLLTSNEWKHR